MADWDKIVGEQRAICLRFRATWAEAAPSLKIGMARDFSRGLWPINGLRHPATDSTTGWYFWAGTTFSNAPDFFAPYCLELLENMCPMVLPYLGLSPGWRFLLAPDYEDVWHDPALLQI